MSQPFPVQPMPRIWPMYRSMVGIGLLCGLLIVMVYEGTRPIIERNRAEALERAIFQVLPAARSSQTFRFVEGAGFELLEGADAKMQRLHAGYGADGQIVGLAVEARGMGYQDVIGILYGYAPDKEAIIGMRVLESRETPGLGDKIETDGDFLANFEGLDVSLSPDGSRVAQRIQVVKRGTKAHPWQIDGITGATISSGAIANILDTSTATWIPRIRRSLDDFRGAE